MGVVVDIERIYYNKVISKPTTYKTCTNYRTSTPTIEKVLLGGLIGSVIGNQISDVHGAGTMGAIVGSMFATDDRKTLKLHVNTNHLIGLKEGKFFHTTKLY